NAFFESLSGFTTTGLSIFSTVANLPKSILFWRALTQWMGGMGIIIIFLSVLRSVRTSSMTLYRSQGLSEKIEPSLISTSRYILKIFITYTLLGIVALFATGLPLFDSITTAFTAISTGGFTVVDTFYTNPATLAVISILMLLGSINFILHSKLFKKNFNEFLKNPEVKGIAVMLIFLISAGFIVSGSLSISIFQMISALTATGFSITDTASLSPLFIVLIIIAMIIGSSSGSTAGGIKQMRFIIALKSILWTIKKTRAPPNAIIPFKINGKVIHSDIVKMTGIFIFTYILILVISSLILMFSGYTPQESIFQCASAQGTVGLSVIDISSTPIIVKLTLCIVMLLGRLEIFPLLILLYNVFSR
ncbi:MAG: TrkH family potassium uptake protein, partial [Candidatus Aenigmarchaeota archaeon]|nr:TrkH family potassium uptake protein [Candidatus Aenigmarchaeota archaeon]